ncbi:hypothetical protein [Aliamphritea spongicola]|nr:hypothetical protein [Aliamphritea spongicola]
MAFPKSSPYVIVGAGIHGLSTAYHLALELKNAVKAAAKTLSSWISPASLPVLPVSPAVLSVTTTSSRLCVS